MWLDKFNGSAESKQEFNTAYYKDVNTPFNYFRVLYKNTEFGGGMTAVFQNASTMTIATTSEIDFRNGDMIIIDNRMYIVLGISEKYEQGENNFYGIKTITTKYLSIRADI